MRIVLSLLFLILAGIFLFSSCRNTETVAGPTVYVTETVDLSSGLVLYYPLAGNVIDSSGSGLNGVEQNIIYGPDRFGTSNSAAAFNGTSSFIRAGDVLDTVFCKPVARFTVAGWAYTIQPGSSTSGGGMIIGKNGGGLNGPYEFSITHLENNIVADIFFDTLATNYVRLTYPMISRSWFHFALVFDGSLDPTIRAKIYINGLELAGSTRIVTGSIGTGCTNSSQHLTIGSGHPQGNPTMPESQYNGVISDIRIYNRPLPPSEIVALYSVK